jgi:hypothetical protein
LLLALACLTKQTAGIYLLAATATCCLQASRRSQFWRLCVWSAGGIAAALIPLQFFEPQAIGCLLGEGASPFSFEHGLRKWQHLLTNSPDLPFFALIGLITWWPSPQRNADLFILTLLLLLSAIGSSAKIGADLNYFLGLRGIAAVREKHRLRISYQQHTRASRKSAEIAHVRKVGDQEVVHTEFGKGSGQKRPR